MTYLTGYNGTVRTREQLEQWSQWQRLDPEMQRRVLWLLDASAANGTPLGIGEIFRLASTQLTGFLSRHYVVASGGCCSYNGRRYALRAGMAHMAPPGRSYHEETTPDGKALAIDFTGALGFLKANGPKVGIIEFSQINNEPWHGQPGELPHARAKYTALMHPLGAIALPPIPGQVPLAIDVPTPTLRQGGANVVSEVRELQLACNFWGWRDIYGRTLLVDGDYGSKTDQAVRHMQIALSIGVDGVYGPQTAGAFRNFVATMTALAGR